MGYLMAFFLPVFKRLNDAKVRYVAVGGVATILHGYVRATTDIDLIVDLQVGEAEKVIRVLADAGYQPYAPVDATAFAEPDQRNHWIESKGMTVFALFHPDQPGLSIDLFIAHPIPFDELWERSVVFDVGGTNIRACAIDDLIKLKKIAGRKRDQDDIEKLRKIKAYGKRSENPHS